MRNITTALLIIFGLLNTSIAYNQSSITLDSKSEVTYAKKLGTVKPISITESDHILSPEKIKLSKRDFKKPKNFEGRFPKKIVNKELEHLGPDKLRQKQIFQGKRLPIEILVNQDGLDNGSSPQDPSGDVGINYYMQAVNSTNIGVYSKDGAFVDQFRTNSLWNEFNLAAGGDPIILYDQESNRWIITEFPSFANFLLVAISETSDPLGEYNVYNFSTPRFPDYPKYSIWNNAYVVTTNEAGFGELHTYFINRQELIDGAENVTIIRTSVDGPNNPEQSFIVATPVDWSGASPPPADSNPFVLSLADASWTNNQTEDMINVNSFEVNWDSQSVEASIIQIPVSPYDANPCGAPGFGFACVPQKNGNGLDGLPEIITFQPHYRNFGTHEAVVFNFITDVTDGDDLAGIRWIELRRTVGTDWALYQEGTFAPDDGLHRFMGSIALDGQGNMGMAYSTSSQDDYASLRFTGRLAGDELGIMTLEENIAIEGTGTINAGGRFGDYPHITIDPVDNTTFWFTSEYAKGSTSATRILAFKVAKNDFDIGPTVLVQPQSSPDLSTNEAVRIVVKNLGLNEVPEYTVGYQLDNGPIFEEQINTALAPDAEFQHTFSTTIDASKLGDYQLKLFTTYVQDETVLNDTIFATFENQARLDLGVFNIETTFPEVCGTESDLTYVLSNLGTDNITSADIEIKVNGVLVETLNYSAGLSPGESVELAASVSNLTEGTNQIEITASAPNGSMDQISSNNTFATSVEVMVDGVSITLELLTDSYPGETSWELLNSNNESVYSSNGNLANDLQEVTLFSNFCLDPDECYTFAIYDDIGDGLSSFLNPSGSYQLYDDNDQVYVGILDPGFGTEERNSFCVDYECNLEANIMVENVTSNQDGTIIIEVTNGAGPVFQYSLDGGATFGESNIFENLEAGTYSVVVKDDYGCITENIVELIDATSAVKKIANEKEIIIFPNPTSGIVDIEIRGYNSEILRIPVQVYNLDGRKIQNTTLTNYSSTYKGVVSLIHHPVGTYFLNFELGNDNHMLRVVKQ